MTSKQDGNDAPARTSASSSHPASGDPAAPANGAPDPANGALDAANGAAIGALDAPNGAAIGAFEQVLEMVRFLRAHCPWDREQTPRSLLPYLLEEAQEVAHHVEDGDDDALASELGDLLLHVAFQAVLAEERSAFASADPAARVLAKMRRRHPHLFGLGEARDWEEMKAEERAADATQAFSHLDNLARDIDALARAQRIQDRVSSVGFDWDDAAGAFAKVREEVEEVAELSESRDRAALEEEIGDLLFAVVNFARLSGVHGGLALASANAKFERRFRALERLAPLRGVRLGEASLEELDRLWDEVKAAEKAAGDAHERS